MNITFINPLPEGKGLNDATIEPPLGLAYMASLLLKNGHKCSIIDANALRLSSSQVIKSIASNNKIIGLYINSFSYSSVKTICSQIKKSFPETIILLGGPIANIIPKQLLEEIHCHAVIKGEGEYAVLKLVENIESNKDLFQGVSGATYIDKQTKKLISNPVERITNLDSLPFPAYHLLPPLNTYRARVRKKPMAAIITSRGCAHRCSFCSKDVFAGKTTYRSSKNVLQEIDYLVRNYSVRQIDILDDNFTQNKARVSEILDGIIARKYNMAINLQLGVRLETLNEKLLLKMKKAGIYKLGLGLESADPHVLRLCNKNLDIQRAEEVIKLVKKAGLLIYGFFIIGLPGETEESFNKTLDFAIKTDLDIANFCMAIPFLGTELYDKVKNEGEFLVNVERNIDAGFYGGQAFFEHGLVTKQTSYERYHKAYKKFYTLSRKIKMLGTIKSIPELIWHINAVKFVLKSKLA